MKILYLTMNRSKMIVSHFENWHKDLARVLDIDFIKRDIGFYKIGQWARMAMEGEIKPPPMIPDTSNYDWIVTDSNFAFPSDDWSKVKIPKAMIIEDSHIPGNPVLQMKLAVKQKFDIVFYRYKASFLNYQKKYLDKFDCRWLPHSVNLEMFKDYELDKKYGVTMTGWYFPEHYPYRHKSYELLKDKEYFAEIPRPNENTKKKQFPFDNDYAKILNQSKISITGGLLHNQAVMKYFEYPACRCLLMSNWFSDLEELGFEDGVNMVVSDYVRLDEQVQNLLNDDDKRNEITDNGYNFIRSYHSGEVRAKQLLDQLGV